MSLISAPRKLRQMDYHEFEVNLDYSIKSCPPQREGQAKIFIKTYETGVFPITLPTYHSKKYLSGAKGIAR